MQPHLELFEFAEICAAANLANAEECKPACDLIIALHCPKQRVYGVGCLGGACCCAQHSYALGNVVLGCLAYLLVLTSSQQRWKQCIKGGSFALAADQDLEELLQG